MLAPPVPCQRQKACLVKLPRLPRPVPRVHQAQHEKFLALLLLAFKPFLRPLQALSIQLPDTLCYFKNLQDFILLMYSEPGVLLGPQQVCP